jgi:hypothetical protein
MLTTHFLETEYPKCISTRDEQTHPLPCQQGHKKLLNIRWPNPIYNKAATKCISAFVAQTTHMPTITQNKSQNVLTKHYHACTGTKSVATCVD